MVQVVASPRERGARRSPPGAGRQVLVGSGIVAVAGGLVATAWSLAPATGAVAVCASVAAGVAAMLLLGSLVEWLVHGRLMHGRSRLPLLHLAYDLHHRAHHWIHYPPDAYLRAQVGYVPLVPPRPERLAATALERAVAALGQGAFYAAFALPLVAAGWALTGNGPFVLALGATAAAIVLLCVHVHDAVHCPGHSPLERFGWFWFLDRHHYLHHVDNRANVNFLLPLCDLLMGTLRRSLSEDERRRWPGYEEARAVGAPLVQPPGDEPARFV